MWCNRKLTKMASQGWDSDVPLWSISLSVLWGGQVGTIVFDATIVSGRLGRSFLKQHRPTYRFSTTWLSFFFSLFLSLSLSIIYALDREVQSPWNEMIVVSNTIGLICLPQIRQKERSDRIEALEPHPNVQYTWRQAPNKDKK